MSSRKQRAKSISPPTSPPTSPRRSRAGSSVANSVVPPTLREVAVEDQIGGGPRVEVSAQVASSSTPSSVPSHALDQRHHPEGSLSSSSTSTPLPRPHRPLGEPPGHSPPAAAPLPSPNHHHHQHFMNSSDVLDSGNGHEADGCSTTYVGQLNEQNKFHGMGSISWPDGRKYVGQWRDGVIEGTGHMRWEDGSAYRGEFKDGLVCAYPP